MAERHEQALKVPLNQLHLLGHLPPTVEVLRVLSPNEDRTDWIVDGDKAPLYLHIRHPVCFAATPGSWLAYEHIESFLSRYAATQAKRAESEA